jgi:hypothetical protein
MGHADLIGPGKHQLVPSWQPAGTGKRPPSRPVEKVQKFTTKGVFGAR